MLGLEALVALRELYLSHNGIWRLEGLSTLTNLEILDVSNNRISMVENLASLSQLEDLWLNDNQIPSLDEALQAGLKPVNNTLTTIYLENNPAVSCVCLKRKLAMLPCIALGMPA